LTWTDHSGKETGFRIEQATSSTGPWTQVGSVASGTNGYSASGPFSPSTHYFFRVRAYEYDSSTGYTYVYSAYTPMLDVTTNGWPAAPGGLTAVAVSDTQISLQWTDNATDETGFEIDRATNSTFTSDLTTFAVAADTTTYSDAGLPERTQYYYRVRAINAVGASANTSTANVWTPLAAPTDLAATPVSGNRIDLTWIDHSGEETGFYIEQATSSEGPWTQLGSVSSGTNNYSATGPFSPSTHYFFRVRAYEYGYTYVYSAYTLVLDVTTNAWPVAPSGLTATAVSDVEIDLNWTDNATDETGFEIDRATNSTFTSDLTTFAVAANTTSYSDSGLLDETTYYYRIRAINGTGNSANAAFATAHTGLNPSVDASVPGTVHLAWNAMTEATGYDVYRKPDGGNWTLLDTTGATSYTDFTVASDGKYSYGMVVWRGGSSSAMIETPLTLILTTDGDYDGDDLSNLDEYNAGTSPTYFDSDEDLLPDGWEVACGLNPLSGDQNSNNIVDTIDDFDTDGLTNLREYNRRTNVTAPDTDTDGASDFMEVNQGSDPIDAADNGLPWPEDMGDDFTVTGGDPSLSNSERWVVHVGDVQYSSPDFGEVGSDDYFFKAGKTYDVTLQHLATRPSFLEQWGRPDYDWEANIAAATGTTIPFFIIDENTPLHLLGPYQGDQMSEVIGAGNPAGFSGKHAKFCIPMLDADIDSNNDGGFAVPADNVEEDRLERDSSTGKVVVANTGDIDGDGIIDSQDFDGIAGGHFVPLVLRPSQNISEANPSQFTISLTYDSLKLRIWKPGKDASASRTASDIITSGQNIPATELGIYPGGETVVFVEALQGSTSSIPITVNATVTGSKWSGTLTDTVYVIAIAVDVDIDSDNTNNWDMPDRSAYEDQIEHKSGDASYPGKLTEVNEHDGDNDGIPDYADGFNKFGGTSDRTDAASFVPLVIELMEPIDFVEARLRITYDASDPDEVTLTGSGTEADPYVYTPAEGHLRIWTKDADVARNRNSVEAGIPGDYVPSGTYDDVSALGFNSATRVVTLYVEGIAASATFADQSVKVEIDPDGGGPLGFIAEDAVCVTIVSAHVKSIEFTSDHGLLKKDPTTGSIWGDSSEPFESPEWVAGRTAISPISQTRNTNVTATVKVEVKPAGIVYALVGSSDENCLSLGTPGTTTSNGSIQEIDVTSYSSTVGCEVGIIEENIEWGFLFGAESHSGFISINAEVSGPHKVYVTYGTPVGNITEKRLAYVCESAKSQEDATAAADAIGEALARSGYSYDLSGPRDGPSPIWLLHDGGHTSQCPGLAMFVAAHFDMLGLTGSSIRYCYAKADGTCAYDLVGTTHNERRSFPVAGHATPTTHDDDRDYERLLMVDGGDNVNYYEATCYYNGWYYFLVGDSCGRQSSPFDVVDQCFSVDWYYWDDDATEQPGGLEKWLKCTEVPWG